jgi:hypothetical protein
MTSLQQTAMGGGSTTAKTASYVLVAADAGTVVQMNSASATTITVNTALFAAGDTVQIQNVGTGVCTVTAGTATVSTSSTLALKQYDAGSLYFNTTSAAIFFATDAADSTSPLTTKGDLYGFSTLDARIPIGTNNQVLTADSTQALGLKWATPSSGGKLLQLVSATFNTETDLSTTTFTDSGLTATITPTSATSKIYVQISAPFFKNATSANNGVKFRIMRGASAIVTWAETSLGNSTATNNSALFGINYIDSPATTSATTYKLQFANVSATAFVRICSGGDFATIQLLEIGA